MNGNDTQRIVAYTDGSCIGNPGSGGWAVVIASGDAPVEHWGSSQDETTNNRMEMKAAIEAIKRTDRNRPVTVVTDR